MAGTAQVIRDRDGSDEALTALADALRRHGLEPSVRAHFDEQPTDLVVLDGDDSWSACKRLKLDRATNLIPVIVMTTDLPPGLCVAADVQVARSGQSDGFAAAITRALAWGDEVRHVDVRTEVSFLLHSDVALLDELEAELTGLFTTDGLSRPRREQFLSAIRELTTNAIEWGNQKIVERIVTVRYRLHADRITVLIRDTGPGFNPANVPHAARTNDPITHMHVRQELGLREGGFGILMSKVLVDDLHYNDAGNEVTLVKLRAEPTPS